jgi:hypothetical protein
MRASTVESVFGHRRRCASVTGMTGLLPSPRAMRSSITGLTLRQG